MSPNNKKKLIVLRKKLDLLDNQLIKILKKRFNVVQNVLKLKEKKSEIIDHIYYLTPQIKGIPICFVSATKNLGFQTFNKSFVYFSDAKDQSMLIT